MNTLELNIEDVDSWGYKLYRDYTLDDHLSFEHYLKSLDENIIHGKWLSISGHVYIITFKDGQSKMFFILKYL